MRQQLSMLFFICALFGLVRCDVYLHNPRGSNNRLDERGRERANANRMFDSQNNNRGGYNVGSLYYYEGSELPIEWTNQHSCGEKNAHCELVVQYMCDDQLRDGAKTRTIPEKLSQCANFDCDSDLEYGMNENYDWYQNCKYRERNKGLFTADQKLKGETAKYTRQNPGGTRRGYECPEERDYYPYWHPTPWKDIAIMTNNVSRCEEYLAESQNVKEKYSCVPPKGYMEHLIARKGPARDRKILPITKEECEKIEYPANSGNFSKWTPTPAWGIEAPACLASPKSRDNHNGNGPSGFPNMFNWTILNTPHEHCALRLRYNISTADYDAVKTNASNNAANNNSPAKIDIGSLVGLSETDAEDRGYVFENNPTVNPLSAVSGNTNIGKKLNLQLAINTAQYGRTFEDRSHSFAIRARTAELKDAKIHNLNVRGKRGNIVQVYPAVEYDFVPNRLSASVGDHIHFQWTGSNTNPNNNDGQGLAGTDRNNVVLLTSQIYPEGEPGKAVAENLKFGHFGNNYPAHLNGVNLLGLPKEDLVSLAVLTPGQLRGELSELDDAGTYFDLPPRKITRAGDYHYMCTRNNNFSNRGQKGKIVVSEAKSAEQQVGYSGGAVQLSDNEGVWIKPATVQDGKQIRVEQWDESAGEEVVKQQGGELNKGDSYESKYFVVYPFEKLANGAEVTIKMKVESDDAEIYHSTDYKNWREISGADISDNVATFQAREGGVYVARKSDNSKTSTIVGGVIGGIVAIVLIVGIVIFCRKHPETGANLKQRFSGLKMGSKV
ncbi:protein DD3-3-like isoform X2 [Hydractinia symbiolongicarpus]|nr:protein DD3-3-like isoform X2 [Hydractinia symbiolongicarpus]XP_057296383.1 protein DD3-3-like isoform X2 [Hydractinia symbiolongicarpus]XP_057296384.1 protein DD3-3-like isoform X2 [Hydractinia symbiolongicarpus]XP_057296385.1 protein DD3-3-like isoform X2 [Hydractinia symbiolongicarpus]